MVRTGTVSLRPARGNEVTTTTYRGPFVVDGCGVWLDNRGGSAGPMTLHALLGKPDLSGGWVFVPAQFMIAISTDDAPG